MVPIRTSLSKSCGWHAAPEPGAAPSGCGNWAGALCTRWGRSRAASGLLDNDAEYVEPLDKSAELRADKGLLAAHRDVASASVIEIWIDETERRTCFCSSPPGTPASGRHRALGP